MVFVRPLFSIQSFTLIMIFPIGRHRKGRKQSLEGSIQVVSRLNPVTSLAARMMILMYMAQQEENTLCNLLCSHKKERGSAYLGNGKKT